MYLPDPGSGRSTPEGTFFGVRARGVRSPKVPNYTEVQGGRYKDNTMCKIRAIRHMVRKNTSE